MNISNNYIRTASYNTVCKEEPKATWDLYLKNNQDENFEAEFGVKKGDAKAFAEKYNLTITRLPNISPETLLAGNDLLSNFTVTENKGFSKSESSCSLVPGMDIDLSNGMVLKVKENIVDVYCKDDSLYNEQNYIRASNMAAALNKFIRYANGQGGSLGFDDEQRKLVASILERQGIDTDKEFSVNGTSFSTDINNRGTLEKIGVNPLYTILPEYMMKKVLESYDANSKWV